MLSLLPRPVKITCGETPWKPLAPPELKLPVGWDGPLQAGLSALPELPLTLVADDSVVAQGYRLFLVSEGARIEAANPEGAFYGLQTLRQLLVVSECLPCLEIEDAPAIPLRGVMWDAARDSLLTLPEMKRLVDLLVMTKQNLLCIYVEDGFTFAGHPTIGGTGARLTPSYLRELDAYCRERFVTLVPNFACLGHMGNILRMPEYTRYADNDTGHSITPGVPETYAFLSELLDAYLPCFSAPYFHINCDESFDLLKGEGKSAAALRTKGFGKVYCEHLEALSRISARHGKRIVFWGDMLAKHQDSWPDIPEGAVVNQWAYEDKSEFINAARPAQYGLEAWISPSVCVHNSLFSRQDNAKLNILRAAGIAAHNRFGGFLNTVWHNNWRGRVGGLSLPSAAWHGIAYGGECAWNAPRRNDPTFESRLARLLFPQGGEGLAEAWRLLGTAYHPAELWDFDSSGDQQLFWETSVGDKLTGDAPSDGLREMRNRSERGKQLWLENALGPAFDPALNDEFALMADMMAWTVHKALVLLKGEDREGLAEELAALGRRFLVCHTLRFLPPLSELVAERWKDFAARLASSYSQS